MARFCGRFAIVAVAFGCARPGNTDSGVADSVVAAPASNQANGDAALPTAAERAQAARRPERILFIGTSLTAGYRLDPADAYPALVGRMLDSAGRPVEVINAGVSGETSAGALRRIEWVLRTPADIVVIETGANDGLRGLSVAAARANIAGIIDRVRRSLPEARILLVQMEAPTNMGPRYTAEFREMFPALARAKKVELVPFLLDGVAGDPAYNLDDGIHPNPAGARIVARTMYNAISRVPPRG